MNLTQLSTFLHDPVGTITTYVTGILTTPMFLFVEILAGALVVMGVIWFLEQRKTWGEEILEGITGVKEWRDRLNVSTDKFVALGAEPMLARAVSKSDDPVLSRLSGQTLTLYQNIKDMYLGMSYAYNCGSRAVQQAEAMFKIPGPLKLVTIRNAGELAEQGLEIKEINKDFYRHYVAPDRYAPAAPTYKLGYIFDVCEKLHGEIVKALKSIADGPGQVRARLATADKSLAGARGQYDALMEAEVKYLPYDQKVEAINSLRARVTANIECDPLGALALCKDLDAAIAALTKELEQAKQQLAAVNTGSEQLKTTEAYMAKVRSTAVTCPWADAPSEPTCWLLDTADSNPDPQLNQSTTLLAQARQSLADGHLSTVSGECNQANAARQQAEKMVKALFDAKAAIDAQVPTVRLEVAAVRAELNGITGGESTHEMALLVERTCAAVEGRINEVYALYLKQHFPEALNLLTGTAGAEYGLPVSKLLAQSKELLKLLQQAAKVASSLAAQTPVAAKTA